MRYPHRRQLALAISLCLPIGAALAADTVGHDAPGATLDPVQVRETRARSDNQNVTTLSAKELRDQGAQSMEDVVRYVPGVEMVDLGRAGFNGFNIRGLEADRVAMTLDGLSFPQSLDPGTYQPYEFFRSGRGSVDLEAVKRVEIIKGADAITAGSGALSGAVMFTTKDPSDFLAASGNDSHGSLKYGYTGSSDENMGSLTLANRTGKFESLLIYSKRDGHETESWYDTTIAQLGPDRRTPDPIDRDSDNLLAKVNFLATDNQTLGVIYERARATNDVDNWTRSDGMGAYFRRTAVDRNDRDRYGLKYTWRPNAALFDTFEASADHQKSYIQGQTNVEVASGSTGTHALFGRRAVRAPGKPMGYAKAGPPGPGLRQAGADRRSASRPRVRCCLAARQDPLELGGFALGQYRRPGQPRHRSFAVARYRGDRLDGLSARPHAPARRPPDPDRRPAL